MTAHCQGFVKTQSQPISGCTYKRPLEIKQLLSLDIVRMFWSFIYNRSYKQQSLCSHNQSFDVLMLQTADRSSPKEISIRHI